MTRRTMGAALVAASMAIVACAGDDSTSEDEPSDVTAIETTSADTVTTNTDGVVAPTTQDTSTASTRPGTIPATTTQRTEGTRRPGTTTPDTRPPITGNFPTQAVVEESAFPRVPLVGNVLDQGQLSPDRPALVVKIDNAPPSRPQSGLNEADVVFEEIVEYGITRFAAVFHSQSANPVGPIRSGRTQDVNMLGSLNQPLFAWSGGNAGVTQAIEDSDLVNLNALYTPGYFRTTDRSAPHNLYSSTDALWARAPAGAPQPGPLFRYLDPRETLGDGLDMSTSSGAEMSVGSLRVRWEWSPETGTYRRLHYGSAHMTADSGQVNTQNLVILKMVYKPSPVDARSPEAQTLGEGPAVVLAGGKVIRGHWVREERTDMFALYQGIGQDAKPIKLPAGRTFVELMDLNTADAAMI